SRKLGLNTDASVRFSKGIDPDMTMEAIKNTVSIISDVASGEIASEVLDLNIHEIEPRTIKFNMQEIKRLSGQTIETEESLSYLERLGLKIENRQNINTNEAIITAPKTINVY